MHQTLPVKCRNSCQLLMKYKFSQHALDEHSNKKVILVGSTRSVRTHTQDSDGEANKGSSQFGERA